MSSRDNKSPIEISVRKEINSLKVKNVLIALSGGADSIATAFALKKAGLQVKALHCNFHLRGRESDRDMEFVEEFCKTYDIPLEIKEFDVEGYKSVNKNASVEMACRNLRHEWFRERLCESGAERIVTGHNADDNIETFFLNVLRGSGSRGLKGMEADNGVIWRPLLSFHRHEILSYLNENKLTYVVDSTNLESDYRRNFLRNKVIPLLKSEWEGFETALDKTLKNLEAENRLVEKTITDSLPLPLQPLPVSVILNSPAPLLLLQRFIGAAGPFRNTAEEILSAIKADKPHIRRWRLKSGMVFLRNGNLFIEMGHGESRT